MPLAVSLSGTLAGIPVIVVVPIAALPSALVRPLRAPLLAPVRSLGAAPLLPVPRGHVVVLHRHDQQRSRHELRAHHDPRAVVAAAHVPAAALEGPILTVIDED